MLEHGADPCERQDNRTAWEIAVSHINLVGSLVLMAHGAPAWPTHLWADTFARGAFPDALDTRTWATAWLRHALSDPQSIPPTDRRQAWAVLSALGLRDLTEEHTVLKATPDLASVDFEADTDHPAYLLEATLQGHLFDPKRDPGPL